MKEAVGAQEHKLLHTTLPAPAEQILTELRTHGRWQGELKQRKKNGDDVVVQSVWVLSETEGEEYIVESNADITDLVLDIAKTKSLEAKLKSANSALERSNYDLHQFTYAAGHDLKEPLRAVSVCAALLSRRLPKPLGPEMQELLSSIENGANRMQTMIDALLEYARATEKTVSVGQTSVAAAVSNALMNLRIAIEESAAEIIVGALPEVTAEGELLTHVFQNLIGNAIKYKCPNERPYIAVSANKADAEWVFTVADHGTGFHPEQGERIFHLFTRVKEPSAISGSGIGLAICKRIVERHGGKIWAESLPGRGSAFHFSIPEPAAPDAP